MSTITLSLDEARNLAVSILSRHQTSAGNAISVANALIAAEVDGQKGHGLSRLPSYAAQSASGKVDGQVLPKVVARADAAVRIDAAGGFAFPALEIAYRELAVLAPRIGIAAAAVFRSHHFGQAGYHVEKLAEQGMIGLAFGNSPKAIAPWGGSQGVFGTNPIAFGAPRRSVPPLIIDLSLSKVARGKVMVAAENGEAIPEGWALNAQGQPTTDPKAALDGTMLPMGDAKGAALVLMVEILSAALTNANFGFEASSFFSPDGSSPGVGQLLVAIAPEPFAGGGFFDRLECLLEAILDQPGTRLPGQRRLQNRELARENGIAVSGKLYKQLMALNQ
ncbi:MAG: Ldh family oxidoreductase [Gammaproteobacteria bacterium]|nr:Ldh family oxidoreductase [Gammaproteobacteria bacterium]